jgi:hypothetical protein
MYRLVDNILHRALDKKQYNILTWPTHERYESGLAKTGHNFFAWSAPAPVGKGWNKSYANIPDNYTILNIKNRDSQLYQDVGIDFILSQNKFGQFDIAQQLQKYHGVPIINLEHTLPATDWHPQQIVVMKKMAGDVNVFISEHSRKAWGWEPDEALVVHHGVDTDIFKPGDAPRENTCLSVVNDWKGRDWCCNYQGWKRIIKGLPFKVLGSNPGLSEPAGVDELSLAYRNSRIFVNTSTVSPIPTALLEAMSSGCAIVTTATCMIPEVVENGVNGFMSNDEAELRGYIELLLKDEALAARLGQAARETIEKRFSMDKFVNNWNAVFDGLMEKT